MATRLTQGDAVVAVPGVRDGLPRVLRNTTREMEGRLCGKCLPFTEFVQWREINGATGRAIVLSCDHHAVAPRHIFAVWHTLDDAESFVSEEVFIYSLLPMEGHRSRSVACLWWGGWVDVNLDRWPLHTG